MNDTINFPIENTNAALAKIATNVRLIALKMIYKAQSGHPGGSLSAADILTVLYFDTMRVFPDNPHASDRDYCILSKGHCCPALYACLYLRGYFGEEHLHTLRRFGSILQGHPDMKKTPGVDFSTGSLGQGAAAAVGLALGTKLAGRSNRIFAVIGDGECQEGIIWEAAQTAVKYNLDNLIFIVDENKIQNDGFCCDVMPTGNLAEKFRAFGFRVQRADGHSISAIRHALDIAVHPRGRIKPKPHCIIFNTVKGKGVSFMENDPAWHGMPPNDEQYTQAVRELSGDLL